MNGQSGSGMMRGSSGLRMMQGYGNGMGMMDDHSNFGMMNGWYGSSSATSTQTLAQAQQRVEAYIATFKDKNLVLDEVIEFQRNFYAVVNDASTGHGAFEVLVNKTNGAVMPEFGPDMMWNTKYGMMTGWMGGMMGYSQPTGAMQVSSDRAATVARQWLDKNQPGATPEAADQFPGYYTVHFDVNGKVAGMLSVDGYSGAVWYHSWHGSAIGQLELNHR